MTAQLREAIARLRKALEPSNYRQANLRLRLADVRLICDALEGRLLLEAAAHPKFDKVAYMREYMRNYRRNLQTVTKAYKEYKKVFPEED
jgi:hypothetical protein